MNLFSFSQRSKFPLVKFHTMEAAKDVFPEAGTLWWPLIHAT